jgi:hypothetical protein
MIEHIKTEGGRRLVLGKYFDPPDWIKGCHDYRSDVDQDGDIDTDTDDKDCSRERNKAQCCHSGRIIDYPTLVHGDYGLCGF